MTEMAAEIAELCSSGTPLVYIVTVEEERAMRLCEEASHVLGASFAVWSTQRGLEPFAPGAREPAALFDAIGRLDSPSLVVLLDFHQTLADLDVVRSVRDRIPGWVASRRSLVIIAPRVRIPEGLTADTSVIRLPLPDANDLRSVLEDAIETQVTGDFMPGEEGHRAVTAARGLTALQARRAFVRALRADRGLGPTAIGAIHDEKKRMLATDVGLEQIESTHGLDEMGGLETFKNWMTERAQAFAGEAEQFGLEAPRGVLLLGVQGCGKSLAAKCVARELGVPLLRLDLPRVLGSTNDGESAEENLARALAATESIAPVALWVDEIEKGFAGSGPGRGDSRSARLLGAFSTWLQERRSAVFVVATANDVTALPPELMRRGRFDELFFVDLPDLEARRAILALHLRRRGREPASYELAPLAEACVNYSGAELEQVVVGALHRAFSLGREIEMADLRRVADDLVPLFRTYEEQIKTLREWARGRARTAGREGVVLDWFRRA